MKRIPALAMLLGLLLLTSSHANDTIASGREVTPADLTADAQIGKRLRLLGLTGSRAFAYTSDLSDRVGARLSGSPNLEKAYQWAERRLNDLGASNVHREDCGEFGLGWEAERVWMRMTSPDRQQFLVQPAPWSNPTDGIQTGLAVAATITSASDFEKYRGKLSGKLLFLGKTPDLAPPISAMAERWSDADLDHNTPMKAIRAYYATRPRHLVEQSRQAEFQEQLASFLAGERVKAVILSSGGMASGGATGNVEADGFGLSGGRPWRPHQEASFPIFYVAPEHFGRVSRLLATGAKVSMEYELTTTVNGSHEHIFNIVGELPGTDPQMSKEFVLVGAHIDSWGGGTGATDDGAGVGVSLESLRLLKGLGVPLRRTIRLVMFAGEEEGLLCSQAYTTSHLGHVPRSTAPDQLRLDVESRRLPVGPLVRAAQYEDISAAYVLDFGGGRIRALPTGGDNPKLADIFQQWITPLADLEVSKIYDEPNWPADQSSFTEIGVPGILFLSDPLDYFSRSHHTVWDTSERLVPDDLAQAATVTAALLLYTANYRTLLPRAHAN